MNSFCFSNCYYVNFKAKVSAVSVTCVNHQCPPPPLPNPQLHFMIPTASWSPSASNLFHAFSFLSLDRSDVGLTSGKDVNRVSVNMLSKSLSNISPVSQNNDKHISQGKHEHLIRYMKYDESSAITLKYFFRYSFSVVDLRHQTGCMILSCQFDCYEDVILAYSRSYL